jgi:protein ImuB
MFAALHLTATDPRALDRLDAVAADMTPRWERMAPGDVVLDVSGLRRLFGGPEGIADAACQLALEQGLHVRVATAEAWGVALLRAAWPGADLAYVPAGQEQAALATLPVDALALLPGVTTARAPEGDAAARTTTRRLGGARHYRLSAGHGLVSSHTRMPGMTAADACTWTDVRETLRRWGIRTCGQLAMLPPDDLHARLGRVGHWLQQRARGLDPRPLRTPRPDDPFEQTLELEWPIEGLEPLSFVLPRLLDPLCAHLERRDRAAIVVRLVLRLTDRRTHLRAIELPAPVRDPRVLRTLLLLDLEAHPAPAGIDVITVQVDPAPGRITQHSLLRKALPTDDSRVALLARLTALMGEGRCGSPALVDSRCPGAVAMQPFEPDAAVAVAAARPPLRAATMPAGRTRGEAVEPEFEGGLDTTGYHLRRLRRPWPVTVTTAPGGLRPLSLQIGARGWPDGPIATASGPWRSSGGWWESGAAAETTWDRDEWDVALRDGTTYRVYQDRQTQQWWLEGEID